MAVNQDGFFGWMKQALFRLQHRMAITKYETFCLSVLAGLLVVGLAAQRFIEPRYAPTDAHAALEEQFQLGLQRLAALDEPEPDALHPPAASSIEQVASEQVLYVDLNRASLAELQRLPRIGPAMAQRIVDYRQDVGPFRRVDELANVRGIGPRTLEQLKPHITISD